MKIFLLSDSHGKKDFLDYKKDDILFVHCGDYGISEDIMKRNDVIYVNGNCDFLTKDKSYKILTLINKKILLTHGHKENVKMSMNNLFYLALSEEVDMCFYGHTHIQNYQVIEGITFINPGSWHNKKSHVIISDKIYFYHNDKIVLTKEL